MFIYSLRSTSKGILSLYALLLSLQVFAAEKETESADLYRQMLADERTAASSERTQEHIASGAAAIVIGLFGYYNTAPNPLIKLLYAATQTAGVVTVGQAIRNKNSPRMILEMDELIRQSPDGKSIDIALLKDRLAHFKRKNNEGDTRTLAYTSSILSGLYFYNGFRETGPDKTLRNIYYFLGFNFAVGGGVGFYRMRSGSDESASLTLDLRPGPTVTYIF